MVDKKCVMITGGTGSFGSAMVQKLLSTDVGEIRIFSRDEAKQEFMRIRYADSRLKFYIGDVRDRASVDAAISGVDLLFHAAALKQVPSCEFFPIEAVRTNVMGSENVIRSAIAHDLDCVVCLGTDKAVFPVNTMGMTKGLMEKVAQAAARGLKDRGTRIASVRYGNVMYSRGSVIPLFISQIKASEPITITDPTMTRFMLPLSDAVDLVEFAWKNAGQGDIFIKKAPACTIANLVSALQQLFESDVPVKTIGTRHGEKIYETLANVEELRRSKDYGDYYRIQMDDRDLNYAKYFTEGYSDDIEIEEYNSHKTDQLNIDEVKELLLRIPEVRTDLGQ